MLLVGCLVVTAGPLVVASETAAARPHGAPFGTNFGVSIDRGPGTELTVQITNTGPQETYVYGGQSNLGLVLDQQGSGSTYEVGGGPYVASRGWQCQSQYDVFTCYKRGAFRVGQSLSLEFGMNLCYPSDHAYSIAYTTVDSGDVDLHEQEGHFVGPASQCTTTHVGYLQVSVTAEVQRIADQYRARVAQLAAEKQALEESLPGLQSAVGTARAAIAPADAAVAGIVAQIAQTKSFLQEIGQLEQTGPDSIAAETAARDGLDSAITALHAKIVAAERARNDALARSLQTTLDRDQSQLATLDRSLASKEDQVDQTRERWLSKLRVLDNQLFADQTAQIQATRAAALAASNLQSALGRRAALDTEMFAVAEQLARLDVVISHVYVFANDEGDAGSNGGYGPLVFEAEIPTSVLAIGHLDDNIARVSAALSDIGAKNNQALQQFLDAERLASDALANVYSVIWSTAYKKAAVDFVSNLVDVVMAGRKGGLIGASAETLKKVVETLVKEYAVDRGPGLYGSKGAQEFNSDFDAKLTNVYLSGVAIKAGEERAVKQIVSKNVKDALNKKIGTLVFEKVYGTVPALYEQAAGQLGALGAPSVEEIEQIQQAVDGRAAQFLGLGGVIEGQTKAPGSVGASVGDLAVTILKDVAKNSLKAHFDVQEQQAWTRYFELEIAARMWLPFYQATSDAYWKTYVAYNALLDEKAALLAGYQPVGDAKVLLDRYFHPNRGLEVTLLGPMNAPVTLNADTGAFVDVSVGGRQASSTNGMEFSLPPGTLPVTARGVGLQLAVH